MLIAVISGGIGFTGDGYNNFCIGSIDLQPTILNFELYIREVRVGVGKLIGAQAHLVGASIGALSLSSAAECKVACLVLLVADSHIIAIHGMLIAVISGGSGLTGDGYGDFIRYRRDFQLAVRCHYERYLRKVRVGVLELLSRQAHVVGTNIGALSCGIAGECEVVCRVLRIAGLHIVAGHLLLGTIIGKGAGMTGDGYGDFIRLPCCRKLHFVSGHGERLAAFQRFGVAKAFHSPTGKGIAILTGFGFHELNRAFVGGILCRVAGAPAAAFQIVCHLIAGCVLGIEGRCSLRERITIAEIYSIAFQPVVRVPTAEGVLHAVNSLFLGECFTRNRFRARDNIVRTVDKVRRCITHLIEACVRPCILQFKYSGCNALALNYNAAVQMLIRVGAVVFRDLFRNKLDIGNIGFLDIVIRDACVRKFFQCPLFVLLENRIPLRIRSGHDSAFVACRPLDHAICDIVKAVFAARPVCAGNIHLCICSERAVPVADIVGIHILARFQQVVNLCHIGAFRAGGNRDDFGGALGGFSASDNKRNRCGAGFFCGHLAAFIHRQNFLVAGAPRVGTSGICRFDFCRKLKIAEYHHRIFAFDRNAGGCHRSGYSDLPGVGVGHPASYEESSRLPLLISVHNGNRLVAYLVGLNRCFIAILSCKAYNTLIVAFPFMFLIVLRRCAAG